MTIPFHGTLLDKDILICPNNSLGIFTDCHRKQYDRNNLNGH